MTWMRASVWLVLAAWLAVGQVRAADCPAPELHPALLGNLVKVNLLPGVNGEAGQEGFGFVVDADADGYTIVTARHVITRGSNEAAVPGGAIRIGLAPSNGAAVGSAAGFDGAIPATPLVASDPAVARQFAGRDVALLRVGKDIPLSFAPAVLSPVPAEEGEALCVAGQPRTDSRVARPRLTSEPFSVFERATNDLLGPRLVLGGLREVVNGHSGAPAFGKRGIVGMVTRKSGRRGLALEIDEIRRLVESDKRTFGLTPAATAPDARRTETKGGVPRAVWIAGTVLAGALLVSLASGGGGDDDDGSSRRAGTTIIVPTP